MLEAGPASEMSTSSRRGFLRLFTYTGTGLANAKTGPPAKIMMSGNSTVPKGSIWLSGLSETRPHERAVRSPSA